MAMSIISEDVSRLVQENLSSTIMPNLMVRVKRDNPVFAVAIEQYAKEAEAISEDMGTGVGLGAFLAYALLEVQQKVDEKKHAEA